jgi:hypothetical protein
MSNVTLRPELSTAVAMLAMAGVNVGFAGALVDPVAGPMDAPVAAQPAAASPSPSALTRVGQFHVYLGNLHSHTSYSDGSGTPTQAYSHARKKGKLEFLAITEHNHEKAGPTGGDRADGILIALAPSLYNGSQATSLISSARAATKPAEFLALYGQEFSTISSGNHVNVFDVSEIIRVPSGDYKTLLEQWLPQHPDSTGAPPLLQLNHPNGEANEYGQDDFETTEQWLTTLDRYAELIEVFNGPALKSGEDLKPESFSRDYLRFLDKGLHVGPTGNQDNHYLTWGTQTRARTGVIAKGLNKADILLALRARHVFASCDNNLRVVAEVSVGGKRYLMGDLIPPPEVGTEYSIHLMVRDDDEPEATYKIKVLSDAELGDGKEAATIDTLTFGGNGDEEATMEGLTFVAPGQYVLLRITQSSDDDEGDELWTAPVWFQRSDAPPPSSSSSDDAVASSRSRVFHPNPTCRFAKAVSPANRVTGQTARHGREPHDGCPQ